MKKFYNIYFYIFTCTFLEYKLKVLEHKEDSEQIENLQLQELSKIKKLVLLREQELSEKTNALKEASVQLEKLRTEVTRLRRQEELLSDVQVGFYFVLLEVIFLHYKPFLVQQYYCFTILNIDTL